MLECETNTPEMRQKVQAEAETYFLKSIVFNGTNYVEVEDNKLDLSFEHGQWYVSFFDSRNEKQCHYAVCDASMNGKDYLEFEEL